MFDIILIWIAICLFALLIFGPYVLIKGAILDTLSNRRARKRNAHWKARMQEARWRRMFGP